MSMTNRISRLAALFGDSMPGIDLDTLQPALFLAQLSSGETLYRYRLYWGHVVSDRVAEDFEQWMAISNYDVSASRSGEARQDSTFQQLREALLHWLDYEPDVIDAAATRVFFAVHQFGQPEEQLRWFRALSEPVRERASRIAEEMEPTANGL
jgi:hypothetical protein